MNDWLVCRMDCAVSYLPSLPFITLYNLWPFKIIFIAGLQIFSWMSKIDSGLNFLAMFLNSVTELFHFPVKRIKSLTIYIISLKLEKLTLFSMLTRFQHLVFQLNFTCQKYFCNRANYCFSKFFLYLETSRFCCKTCRSKNRLA